MTVHRIVRTSQQLAGQLVLGIGILAATICAKCDAHDGMHDAGADHAHQNYRIWRIQGQPALTASFVSIEEASVRLLRPDGSIERVALERLHPSDRLWVDQIQADIQQRNTRMPVKLVSANASVSTEDPAAPAVLDAFRQFESTLGLRWDDDFLYVESNGMPDHGMMVGITAWQQQVPLAQAYYGDNAWRIPLHPKPAKKPLSAKSHFFRGAIALAVNGVPIFNPIKNDGKTDTLVAGELDQWGGHCGRADDYHYHIAPIHLEKIVGQGKPIAYALDGYPILGYQDPQSPDFAPLDWMNGHKDDSGRYHYHATKEYPYINGGFYGEVVERDGQVDPQPRAREVRPALTPLAGAKITRFDRLANDQFELTYELRGKTGLVRYQMKQDGSLEFTFQDTNGRTRNETYRAKGIPPSNRTRGPRTTAGEKSTTPETKPGKGTSTDAPNRSDKRPVDARASKANAFQLASASIDSRGRLDKDCTCDGKRLSPAIAWKGPPEGTKAYAISLWHTAPDQEKSYWVVFNIPADVMELPQGVANIGQLGVNDKRRREYDPMCSRGPGVKTYHITVWALSDLIDMAPDRINRAKLLELVKPLAIAETTLDYQYERK